LACLKSQGGTPQRLGGFQKAVIPVFFILLGCEMKRAAVFLDRDGTINEQMGYINHHQPVQDSSRVQPRPFAFSMIWDT
jgi:hypothetical protein